MIWPSIALSTSRSAPSCLAIPHGSVPAGIRGGARRDMVHGRGRRRSRRLRQCVRDERWRWLFFCSLRGVKGVHAGGSSKETLAQRVVKISNRRRPGPPPAVVPHLLHLHDRPMLDAHSRGKSAPFWKTFGFVSPPCVCVLGAVRTGDAAAATQLFAGAAAAGPRATDHPDRKDDHRRDGPNHSVEDAADARPGRHPCVRSRGAAGRGGGGGSLGGS